MVFIYSTLLSVAGGPLPPKVEQRARVSVTIIQAYRASSNSWDPAARRNQKEVVKREGDGTPVLLRLTEFE